MLVRGTPNEYVSSFLCPRIKVRSSYFFTKTYVVGTHKNRLNKTVLLSTYHIILFKLSGKKIITLISRHGSLCIDRSPTPICHGSSLPYVITDCLLTNCLFYKVNDLKQDTLKGFAYLTF